MSLHFKMGKWRLKLTTLIGDVPQQAKKRSCTYEGTACELYTEFFPEGTYMLFEKKDSV